jgi:UDP-N-acetylmuramate dehydrogenase
VGVQRNISLKPFNTFGVDARAAYFCEISGIEDIREAYLGAGPFLILGGGSNVLFTGDFNGTVLFNQIQGKEVVDETPDHVIVEIGSGENWHEVVKWCLSFGYGGLENLSLIPGTVGATPIQNIGAYGVELKDIFLSLDALMLDTFSVRLFEHSSCGFGYRDSIFKRELKDKAFILNIRLRLTKKNHRLNKSYASLHQRLEAQNLLNTLDPNEISKAVIAIREEKLPDPNLLGNAGSFFKNPVIPILQFKELKAQYPEIIYYPQGKDQVKLAAGWLIEACGWKGKQIGNAGCHHKQALVLVNHGDASGKDIYNLSRLIQRSVAESFHVHLETEVNIY